MDALLNSVSKTIRGWMMAPATFLHSKSNGKITPNHVTLVSFLGHFLVLGALWQDRPILAAGFLAFFSILDSLDGALARVQKRQSTQGMFYDAVSDRAKEVLVYIGISRFMVTDSIWNQSAISESIYGWSISNNMYLTHWLPVAIVGCSILISYIKAKGEMAIAQHKVYKQLDINRVFADGIARYEVRMAVVVIGLFTSNILSALILLQILLIVTIFQRFVRIKKVLASV